VAILAIILHITAVDIRDMGTIMTTTRLTAEGKSQVLFQQTSEAMEVHHRHQLLQEEVQILQQVELQHLQEDPELQEQSQLQPQLQGEHQLPRLLPVLRNRLPSSL